jgi:deoxyribodipyrimidine photo-lyase
METAIVVFTRDLRLHDNPALSLGCERARRVVPVFVTDPALPAPPNRLRFLAQSLAGLREALRERGADLVIRHGDPVAEIIRLAGQTRADTVCIADDVSRYAARRRRRLERECAKHRLDLVCTPGVTVVPPTDLRPSGGGDHYRVFTPYWRAWAAADWRQPYPVPRAITMPKIEQSGDVPEVTGFSPGLAAGGERAGRRQVRAWLDGDLASYGDDRDDLAGDGTSRLSPYLRFGCVSPLELARAALARPGGEEFCRQLAWRDFFHQVTAAFGAIARADYRPGPQTWRTDQEGLAAWRAGQTGIPVVDAGMRQLAAEGFMHNRARMITASFLTRTLGIHWRHGYAHFADLLADGDVACNAGNWQWVAGTGNNTRSGRVLNPLRQARRFDPDGGYVRRYVPELAELEAASIHTPWMLPEARRRQLNYPDPVIELALPASRASMGALASR